MFRRLLSASQRIQVVALGSYLEHPDVREAIRKTHDAFTKSSQPVRSLSPLGRGLLDRLQAFNDCEHEVRSIACEQDRFASFESSAGSLCIAVVLASVVNSAADRAPGHT